MKNLRDVLIENKLCIWPITCSLLDQLSTTELEFIVASLSRIPHLLIQHSHLLVSPSDPIWSRRGRKHVLRVEKIAIHKSNQCYKIRVCLSVWHDTHALNILSPWTNQDENVMKQQSPEVISLGESKCIINKKSRVHLGKSSILFTFLLVVIRTWGHADGKSVSMFLYINICVLTKTDKLCVTQFNVGFNFSATLTESEPFQYNNNATTQLWPESNHGFVKSFWLLNHSDQNLAYLLSASWSLFAFQQFCLYVIIGMEYVFI